MAPTRGYPLDELLNSRSPPPVIQVGRYILSRMREHRVHMALRDLALENYTHHQLVAMDYWYDLFYCGLSGACATYLRNLLSSTDSTYVASFSETCKFKNSGP